MHFVKKYSLSAIAIAMIVGFSHIGCSGGSGSGTSSLSESIKNGSATDTQKPHITLLGDKNMIVALGATFKDPGATALDDRDGDLSASIQKEPATIDTSIPGTYEILYKVSDRAGNTDTAKRTVVVLEAIDNPEVKKKQGVVINELLAINNNSALDPDFRLFSDWIELYNNSDQSIDLGGYYLSDDSTDPTKWKIPAGTTIAAKERLVIWADKKDIAKKALHSNFSLSGDGEELILSNPNGVEVDKIVFKKQKRDISVTKLGDRNYYMQPTPNRKNSVAFNANLTSKKPDFNKESGFYSGVQKIELFSENGAAIFYTTDGSIPTLHSKRYSQPISIDKTTVVRARALESGKFLSATKNQTYFIDEKITLPVFSISINDEYLFDEHIGIYVAGVDDAGNPLDPYDMKYAHLYQKWLRPAGLEFFKDGKREFAHNIGIKIHGDGSRTRAQKSLDLYMREKYGTKAIEYPLFRHKPFIKKVKSFMLRKSTDKNPFRDGIAQSMVMRDFDIDLQSYEPTVIFINGNYWGILNIREKENEDYLEANHFADRKKVDLGVITNEENEYEMKAGSDVDYKALIAYVKSHNPNDPAFQAHLESVMEVDEYIDFLIAQTFFNCRDWTFRNIKFWKKQKSGAKFRWMIFDWDSTFDTPADDPFKFAFDPNSPNRKTPPWSTLLRRKFLDNDAFKERFVSRYCTHLNTSFKQEHLLAQMDEMVAEVRPEVDRHFQKWPLPEGKSFARSMEVAYFFLEERTHYVRDYLGKWFGYSGNVALHIDKAEHGKVNIDGVLLEESYDGNYFANTKITLKAIPEVGYHFVRWEPSGATSASVEVMLNEDRTITPIFAPTQMPKVVINEINYKSDKDHESGDWIELYNNDTKEIDLSGWTFKDDTKVPHFTLPSNTLLQPGEYLVLCQDSAKFSSQYNLTSKVLGDFPMNLNKKEEHLRLYNQEGVLVDEVAYDKQWPSARGKGETLSLIDTSSDNSLASNWSVVENYGTPGAQN